MGEFDGSVHTVHTCGGDSLIVAQCDSSSSFNYCGKLQTLDMSIAYYSLDENDSEMARLPL